MKLFNSLTRQTEEFQPLTAGKVGMYTCGPTVYNHAHIGNLRTMVMSDLLRRCLEYQGLNVQSVMNITDVGHLTSDGDSGEDKLEKTARNLAEVQELIQKYTGSFLQNLTDLNILPPGHMPKATEHIEAQVAMIQSLIEKGFAYESEEAVYFDISQVANYTRLIGQGLDDMRLGARQEVVADPKKKNPHDFVLWFKTVGRYANHIQRWPSPWGEGFPGWHIECSAMSKQYLGDEFDIHVGGIDLKFPHHTNEIAQSLGANGKLMARFWVYGEHLLINDSRMGKSEGNFITLQTLIDKKLDPLAYRYLILTSHYRSKLNFTWDSLQAAQNALHNLYQEISSYPQPSSPAEKFMQAFSSALSEDLNTPEAVAVMWDLVKSETDAGSKLATLLEFDKVLGLRIAENWTAAQNIPAQVQSLSQERLVARQNKDFAKSDELRRQIEELGFILEDTPDGARLKKRF